MTHGPISRFQDVNCNFRFLSKKLYLFERFHFFWFGFENPPQKKGKQNNTKDRLPASALGTTRGPDGSQGSLAVGDLGGGVETALGGERFGALRALGALWSVGGVGVWGFSFIFFSTVNVSSIFFYTGLWRGDLKTLHSEGNFGCLPA